MYSNYSIFDDVLGLKNIIDGYFNGETYTNTRMNNSPLINLAENGDHVTVEAVTPGVGIDDINLELVDNTLQITFIRTKDKTDAKCIRNERKFGTFSKTIRMPFRVDPEKISASLKNGILTINLEKSEDAKPKKIMIN